MLSTCLHFIPAVSSSFSILTHNTESTGDGISLLSVQDLASGVLNRWQKELQGRFWLIQAGWSIYSHTTGVVCLSSYGPWEGASSVEKENLENLAMYLFIICCIRLKFKPTPPSKIPMHESIFSNSSSTLTAGLLLLSSCTGALYKSCLCMVAVSS